MNSLDGIKLLIFLQKKIKKNRIMSSPENKKKQCFNCILKIINFKSDI